ncbi:signal peptidase I [Vagococcus salmoninarum]|nr:signal peptidase I [Vagococcus salmoninarum]
MSVKKRKRKQRDSSEILDEFIDDTLRPSSTKRRRKRRSTTTSDPENTSKKTSSSQSGKRRRRRHLSAEEKLAQQKIARRKKVKKIFDGLLIGLFLVIFCSMLVFYLKFDRAEVVSGSMEPTLMTNEKVIIINGKEVKPFNMLVFYPPSTTKDKYVKRVIGLPGDELEFKEDKLFINGKEYSEPYLDSNKEAYQKEHPGESYTKDFQLDMIPGVTSGTTKIPKDMYLVLGDNRQNSQDSRYIGLIPKENVIGVVWKKTSLNKK